MAFGGFSNNQSNQPMAEINMIPLIDVMLVLLVIFIIAAPLMNHAVKIELPKANATPDQTKPETIHLALDSNGNLYWNNTPVSKQELHARLSDAASQQPQPELRIRADGSLAYKNVAAVMADAARTGLVRIGFVTTPVSNDH